MSYTNVSRTETIWSFFGLMVLCALRTQASTLPPDPDNAALLYYQAFLLRPEPDYAEEQLVYNTRAEKIYDFLCGGKLEFDTDIEQEIQELDNRLKNDVNEPDEIPPELKAMMPEGSFEFETQFWLDESRRRREHQQKMRGVDPNETIRKYVKKRRDAIELARVASELADCDWGVMYSDGLACNFPQLAEFRLFARMLCVNALLLAADGNDRAAFEQCLVIRGLAHHVGDHSYILYCVSKGVDGPALDCIKIILQNMKPDVETLTWLRNELVTGDGSPALPDRALKIDFEMTLQSLRTNDDMLEKARQAMGMKEQLKALAKEKLTGDVADVEKVQTVTDEELVALASQPYGIFLDSALRVMNSAMSYQEKSSEIRRLTHKITDEFGGDLASFPKMAAHPERLLTLSIVVACAEQVGRAYHVHIGYKADFNALMAGIELYLIKAQTGQLPEKLPEGTPNDPFTGRDFIYEITEDGFTLSLPDRNVPRADKRVPRQKSRPYEFKVKK